MSKIDRSIEQVFLRLGASPATRSVRAESLFRRLREETEEEIGNALLSAPSRIALNVGAGKSEKSSD